MRIVILFTLALLGCSTKSGMDDPLTGTWKNTSCVVRGVTPPNVSACSTKLTFTSNLDVSVEVVEQNPPASATTPRCNNVHKVSGQTWSTTTRNNMSVVAIAGTAKATVEVTDCVHSLDDKNASPDASVVFPNGETAYQLSGSTLTISSGPLSGTYTRE